MAIEPTREQAWDLLTAHTKSANLLKHALGVEAAMRKYACSFGASEETWGIAGLLHDLDYEEHPSLQEHPFVGVGILRDLDYPEEVVHAILAHADHTGVPRRNDMDRALYAVDEIVGLIVAVALIRPAKSLVGLPVKSVTKKLKDKAFCRAIDRGHLRTGAEALGVEMGEHIATVLESLQAIAEPLGLA